MAVTGEPTAGRHRLGGRVLRLGWWLGVYRPPDRRLLEDVILPYYAGRGGNGRVLFVGVHVRARAYHRCLPGAAYATLDPNRLVRPFGARHHVVGRVEHLERLFGVERFTLIVVNGVLGWGLDTRDDADAALRACHRCLAPGGDLLLGLNERRASTPQIGSLASLALFDRVALPPCGAHRVVVPTPLSEREHTYYFYRKPGPAAPSSSSRVSW